MNSLRTARCDALKGVEHLIHVLKRTMSRRGLMVRLVQTQRARKCVGVVGAAGSDWKRVVRHQGELWCAHVSIGTARNGRPNFRPNVRQKNQKTNSGQNYRPNYRQNYRQNFPPKFFIVKTYVKSIFSASA